MRKILLAMAGALAAAVVLQGCAGVPGSYYGPRYQPPPGYILVPAPQGYGGYYGPAYDPYNWAPDSSMYYLNRGNPFYFPFYAPFFYGHSRQRPAPQPAQPPVSPPVKPAPKTGGTPDPRFVPPGDTYRDFWRRSPHNGIPDDRRVRRPAPTWNGLRERPATIQPPSQPDRTAPTVQSIPVPAPTAAPPRRRHRKSLPNVHQVPPR